jgi:hypothetical protein
MTTCTLISKAQPMGQYKPTGLDATKAAADFLVVATGSKTTIRWADGRAELVSDSKLAKLQSANVWSTDF